MLKKIYIQTNSKTYAFEVSDIPEDERDRMAKFIRKKSTEANQSTTTQQNSSDDPLDKLERLRDLKEDGVITQQEFNEKKEDLLDRI